MVGGERTARLQLIDALQERDEVVVELQRAMSTVNMLRETVEMEGVTFAKAREELLGDVRELSQEKADLQTQLDTAKETILHHERQAAKMQHHITGLCTDVEDTKKKLSNTDSSTSSLRLDIERLERLLKEARTQRDEAKDSADTTQRRLTVQSEVLSEAQKEVEALKKEMQKVSRFEQLIVDQSRERVTEMCRSVRRKEGRNNNAAYITERRKLLLSGRAQKAVTVPPEEVDTVERLADASPAVKYALTRTPARSGGGGGGGGVSSPGRRSPSPSSPSQSQRTMEKFKWASASLNAPHSILSRYYLPK